MAVRCPRRLKKGLKAVRKVIPGYSFRRRKDGKVIEVPRHKRTYYVRKKLSSAKRRVKQRVTSGKVGSVARKLRDPRAAQAFVEAVAIASVIAKAVKEIMSIRGERIPTPLESISRQTPVVHMAIDTRNLRMRTPEEIKEVVDKVVIVEKPNGEFEYIFNVDNEADAIHKVQLTSREHIPIGSKIWFRRGGTFKRIGEKKRTDVYAQELASRGDIERLKELAKWKSEKIKEQREEEEKFHLARMLALYYTGKTDQLTDDELRKLKSLGFVLPPDAEERIKVYKGSTTYYGGKYTSPSSTPIKTTTTTLGKKSTPPSMVTTGHEEYLRRLEEKRKKEIRETGAYTVDTPTRDDITYATNYLIEFFGLMPEEAEQRINEMLRIGDYDNILAYAKAYENEKGLSNVFDVM